MLICARTANDLGTMQENAQMWLSAITVVFQAHDNEENAQLLVTFCDKKKES
ncbi:hypothetical protein BHE74_00019595 [Ensete ventricosum]|nr:hypothetical protein BHE74_00019595 [Ensete ventricosum]RZR88012.1 hypothetical protein BHM03_00015511 [Ensete ventricosum]